MSKDDNCSNESSLNDDSDVPLPEQEENAKANKKVKKKKKKIPSWVKWGIVVLILSFVLSFLFSLLTEVAISDSPVYVCVIALVVLLFLNIGCDMLANAVLSCNAEGFNAMASNKIRGAKRAVKFCKNSTKIASIFADVIGDICGIVSGSAGAALAVGFGVNGEIAAMFISILVSAVIGALTVGGKAFCKYIALKYNRQITFAFAKFTTFFVKEK
ncbi:MAG: hypothetical protein LUD27_03220 [Clostridia bacterium]|nr:hypothetical protein [Clostridia bacterium]